MAKVHETFEAELLATCLSHYDLGVIKSITRFPAGSRRAPKVVIQSGITEVVYLEDKYEESDSVKASRRMFDSAGVAYRKLTDHRDRVVLNFGPHPGADGRGGDANG